MTLRLAWFASARGTSSRLLFNRARNAIADGSLDAEIVCAFCNRERGQSPNTDAFLDDVADAGVPLIARSSAEWRKQVGGERSDPAASLAPWRSDYDEWVRDQIAAYRPDAALLAGYMLIVTNALCDALPMLNLHPAAPGGPTGTWQQVISQIIRDNAAEHGMQLQRVTPELDRGPVVTSANYPIRGRGFDDLWRAAPNPSDQESPLFRAIRDAGVRREPIFIIESLRAYARNPAAPPASLDITETVERRLVEQLVEQEAGQAPPPAYNRPDAGSVLPALQ